MRILVVDDELVVQKFLTKVLARYGRCELAVNGHEAVEMYKQSLDDDDPYDFVVMDIMMPVMDGLEATERISALRRGANWEGRAQTRVVMLSCLDDTEHLTQAQYVAGADAYLTKPLEIKTLEEAMIGLGLVEGGPDAQG